MSHVTQTELHGVIAVVTTDTGVREFGEFVPAPRLCAGQADALHRAHGEVLSALLGQPVERLLELAATLRARGMEHRGAAFGVETASHAYASSPRFLVDCRWPRTSLGARAARG